MDMNLIGSIASIIGLVISGITMIIVLFVDKKVKKLQLSNLFDQRVNLHLTTIDSLQKELNLQMPNVLVNEIRIKEILVQLLTEFESLLPKLQDKKARKKTKLLIYKVQSVKNKRFYNLHKTEENLLDRLISFYKFITLNLISSRKILDIYILINENYNRIQQVKLDKNAIIK